MLTIRVHQVESELDFDKPSVKQTKGHSNTQDDFELAYDES